MKQTFSDLITICQNGAGKDTSTASQTFFKQRINSRDEFIVSKIPSYLTETTRTFSTVADQQYYHYPPNMREIKSLAITINSITYPLKPVESYHKWKNMNSLTIQAGAIPTSYFKRQRDFGIYPILQDAYTGTIVYSVRGGGMVRTGYTSGTATVVENDETVTGTASWSLTANLIADDWFVLTDSNGESRTPWYRISSVTTATSLELESVWEESSESAKTYLIAQCPEGPEEYHELRAYGALADYFISFKQSPQKSAYWSNMFWTGDPTISRAIAERSNKPWTGGGLLGMINDYRDRDDSQLIDMDGKEGDARTKIWGATLSSS
jgi:hypothetical protein